MHSNPPAEGGATIDGDVSRPSSEKVPVPMDNSRQASYPRDSDFAGLRRQAVTVPDANVRTDTEVVPKPLSLELKIASRIEQIKWRPPEHSRAHRFLKRSLDIVISASALIILSPLFLAISLLVFFTDFGSVFYSQPRVGMHGQFFRFFKFRTMVPDADAKKAGLLGQNNFKGDITFKITRDPRVTAVGSFLRKSSLDEFPQLLHVLTGDMTLVGPRPAVAEEVQYYSDIELRRVFVKPGLTCYWQVNGRSNLPFEEQVRLDLKYIRDESLWVDLWILVRTIPALVLMKGAY